MIKILFFVFLLGLGFAFPPIWLLLIVWLVWVFLLRSPARAGLVRHEVMEVFKMGLDSGPIETSFKDVKDYALEHGGRALSEKQVILPMTINGAGYIVTFSKKYDDKGTWVELEEV